MKCHEPGPPLLFTMIMKAMVMPRTTSSETSRFIIVGGALAGLIMVSATAVLVIGESRSPETLIAITLRVEASVRKGRASGDAGFKECESDRSSMTETVTRGRCRCIFQATIFRYVDCAKSLPENGAEFCNTSRVPRTRLAIPRRETYYPQ